VDVLDVGCGPGTITIDLARRAAPGRVVGLDAAADVVAAARTAAGEAGASNLELATGDVYALDHADDSFGVVHAHQVLQHLADPVGALREMRRVCRPSGVVAARDAVYRAMSWYPRSPGLDQWLEVYCSVAEANGGEPDAGSRLKHWCLDAGFASVEVSASAWCFATDDERAWWGETWAERVAGTTLGGRAVELAIATQDELDVMAAAWHDWARAPDARFAVLHGEVLARP
jgi:SAM-dependent methyltransferase